MKKLIFIILMILFITLIYSNIGFQTTYYRLDFKEFESAANTFKIAHISDLHNRNNNKELCKKLKKENPDIIAITGDLIDSNRTDIPRALDFIDRIENTCPIYYIPGNHEGRCSKYPKLRESLTERDVIVLEDRCEIINSSIGRINICGFIDPEFYRFSNSNKTTTPFRLDKIKTSQRFKLLLAHRPDLFSFYEKKGFDLILSGHAHGGQIRLPFIGGLFSPNQGFFPKFTKGIYTKNESKMLISRGLGNSIFPIRFGNKPELVIINLSKEKN